MVYILLAEGFEEVEALTPTDMMRRAGVDAKLVGVTGKMVRSSHGISVETDMLIEDVDWNAAEAVVLPGGLPGTNNLYANKMVTDGVQKCYDDGKYVAAICAAPSIILGGMGLLKGRKATCYPGMEDGMVGAVPCKQTCVVDDNIITGCGVGGAMDFACALVSVLCGEEKARAIAAAAVYTLGE